MPRQSAGILAYRSHAEVEVLLVHPGGPFWRNKDARAWSIPKGEFAAADNPEATARREFAEELGVEITCALIPLGEVKQRGGKQVIAFAAEFDLDPSTIHSNSFELEWPPRSGRKQQFPEVDRAGWFALPVAREKINPAQSPLLDRLEQLLHRS